VACLKAADDLVLKTADILWVRDVAHGRKNGDFICGRYFGGRLANPLLIPGTYRQVHAFGRQGFGNRPAQASAGRRDHGNLSLES